MKNAFLDVESEKKLNYLGFLQSDDHAYIKVKMS